MALRVDERFHRIRIEEVMLVVRRDDVGRRKSEEVEESLFIHFGVKRDSPVVLSVTVPTMLPLLDCAKVFPAKTKKPKRRTNGRVNSLCSFMKISPMNFSRLGRAARWNK